MLPGLDGLRAVAVLAVMAFHAGVPGAGGGQLGVDVFFVLSGFLVTSLLLSEHAATGAIALRSFWARRARRLLPALLVCFLGVCAYARWAATGIAPAQMRGNALATLLYVANWHYVLTGQGYFARSSGTSPLLHTWSLAVEEQFYVIWPLVVILVLRRRGPRALAGVAAAIGGASAALCAVLSFGAVGIDRLYYGTDTRVQTLMVGAVLAAVLATPRAPRSPAGGPLVGAAGVAGAAGLAWCLHAVEGTGPFLYRGGFLVVAVASAAVVLVVARRPSHPVTRALSWAPLRYVGRISYGLYLYHWPLFLVLTRTRTGLGGAELLALRVAVTLAAADVSFRLIERPVRARRGAPAAPGAPGRLSSRGGVAAVGAVGASVAVIALLLAVTSGPGTPAAAASSLPPAGYRAPGGASAGRPERVMLIGDSMAKTLGAGLSRQAGRWGVAVDDEAAVGCDLDPSTTVDIEGSITRTAQGCPDWRRQWARLVARTDPDVVVVLLGRWESLNRVMGGRWTHPGLAAFDAHLQAELRQVVDIGSARGARVVFLTLPYIAETTVQPDGEPWPVNLPARTDAYNADVAAVVSQRPRTASILPLNRLLDPGGRYTSYIDGIRVRSYDDEHISPQGGMWLRPKLLPAIARAGARHYDESTRRGRDLSP